MPHPVFSSIRFPLTPQRVGKILLFLALSFLLLILIGWRYHQLKIRVSITRFFDHSFFLFPATHEEGIPPISGMNPPKDEKLEGIQQQEGNLLNYVKPDYLEDVPEKYLKDPFATNPANPYLPLRYGRVTHTVPVPRIYQVWNKPVWFTWSAGPSKVVPELRELSKEKEIRRYTFPSPVYDVSNGLESRGFLFADSRGLWIGLIR